MSDDRENLYPSKPKYQLLKGIIDSFNLSELRNICFALDVNYEEVPGENTITDKARELIVFMERRNELEHLLSVLAHERPSVGWPSYKALQSAKSAPTPGPSYLSNHDVVRASIWNALYQSLWSKKTFLSPHKNQQPLIDKFSISLWSDYFKKPIDARPMEPEQILGEIRDYFFSCSEKDFYGFVEYILNYWNELNHYRPALINHAVNAALRREGADLQYRPEYEYSRFVSGSLVVDDSADMPSSRFAQESQREKNLLGDVPASISQVISEQAKKRFPDDFSTQKYQVEKETQAWRSLQTYQPSGIPEKVLAVILKRAEKSYPDDFSTRKYLIEKEVQAWKDLQEYRPQDVPENILDQIGEKARQSFPDDFSTRKYQIEKQVQAWRNLQS